MKIIIKTEKASLQYEDDDTNLGYSQKKAIVDCMYRKVKSLITLQNKVNADGKKTRKQIHR